MNDSFSGTIPQLYIVTKELVHDLWYIGFLSTCSSPHYFKMANNSLKMGRRKKGHHKKYLSILSWKEKINSQKPPSNIFHMAIPIVWGPKESMCFYLFIYFALLVA